MQTSTPAEARLMYLQDAAPMAMLLDVIAACMVQLGHPYTQETMRSDPAYLRCYAALEAGDLDAAWSAAVDLHLLVLAHRDVADSLKGLLDVMTP